VYKIFESGEHISVARRHTIETEDKVFYIESGYVALYIGAGRNRRLLVTLRAGNMFPLNMSSRSAIWQSECHYVAMSNVSAYVIPRDKFLPSKGNLNKKELQKRLEGSVEGNSWLLERIVNLLTYDVSKRLYMRLIMLAEYAGSKDEDTVVLEVPLTYQDIAESIATTRETVNRLVTALQNDDIISIDKRIITIKSMRKLRQLYESRS
jgi:CRP/FNR family transcriptional regulator, cyclic AMP receptor protein